MSLTIDHKFEGEILVESVFFDSCKDSVLPSIFLCYIPDHQGAPFHVVSGALLCCHHAILQPVGKNKKQNINSFSAIIKPRSSQVNGVEKIQRKRDGLAGKGGEQWNELFKMESKLVVIPGISGNSYQMTSGAGNARSLGESL